MFVIEFVNNRNIVPESIGFTFFIQDLKTITGVRNRILNNFKRNKDHFKSHKVTKVNIYKTNHIDLKETYLLLDSVKLV